MLVRKAPLVQRVRQGLPVHRVPLGQPDLKVRPALLVRRVPLGQRARQVLPARRVRRGQQVLLDLPVPLAQSVLMAAPY